jgi:hypothetical protein
MKKICSLLALMIIATSSTWAIAKTNINIDAQEIYFAVYPADQYLEIIEYNLVSNKKNKVDISIDVGNLENKIKNAQYSSSKYKFNYFVPVEEKITNEKKFIKGRYSLLTQEKNIKKILIDVFEKIFNKKVEIEITDKEIKLYFDGKGINISQNNALGIYSKNNKRMAVWKNGVTKFEMVVGFDVEGKLPLLKYIKQTVSSSEKTKEEIDQIKYASPKLQNTFQEFQDDADIYRLRHLKYYGALVEEFKKKTEKYPFEGIKNVPVYVFVANDKQEQYTKQKNPNPHQVLSFKKFVLELETKLGKKIDQYFDPQYAPNKKPNFYIYMIRDNQYFFAVHISKYYNFSSKVADNYYKVEISNLPPKGSNTQTYSNLVKNESFIKIINKKGIKEGFFEERESKYINYIK